MRLAVGLLLGMILLGPLGGCSVARKSASTDLLDMKVVQMERELQLKDSEIQQLKYEVSRLSGQQGQFSGYSGGRSVGSQGRQSSGSSGTGGKMETREIIRVSASPSEVQTVLQKAGYYDGAIDGKIGQKSIEAIKSFQRDNNLKVDGIIGARTWAQMKAQMTSSAAPSVEPAIETTDVTTQQ